MDTLFPKWVIRITIAGSSGRSFFTIWPIRRFIFMLGSNLLIFGNLLLILIDLFRVVFRKGSTEKVESTLAAYLPVYLVWTFLVAFGWPLLFGFA